MNTQADSPLVDLVIDASEFAPPKRWVVVRRLLPFAAVLCVLAAAVIGFLAAAGIDRTARLFVGDPMPETTEVYVDLPEVIINLRPGTPSRYLKIAVTLATTEVDRVEVERVLPRLIDAEQEFMRNLDEQDLDGSAGLTRLRDEFRRRANLIIGRSVVSDVLLRGLLTQ